MLSPDLVERFTKNHDENVRALMELMHQDWISIQAMPYSIFLETIKWKIQFEEEKKKKIEERNKSKGSSDKRASMVKNRINRAQK